MRSAAVLLTMCLTAASWAATPAPTDPKAPPAASAAARLPVRRIVLYKNGVGYFEHVGRVRGTQDLTIDFTSAQLNDVLKSLTVVDMGEGRITGVRYDSTAPLSERMKTLRIGVGEQTSQADFLGALRGARVEVRAGAAAVTGKILAVEQRQRANDKGVVTTVADLSLVTDAGELRTFELGPATAVRIIERDLAEDVGRYLDLIGSTRSRDLRRMVISSAGTGDRDLFVGYISEVPVWKSTYRILLPEKTGGKARLQGWAIVDNTVGEDWNDVQLSLVAGAAQSFIQEISRPYYTRRPVVALPESVLLSPQSHQATMQFDRLELFAKQQQPPAAAPASPAGIRTGGALGGVGPGSGGGIAGGTARIGGAGTASKTDSFAAEAPTMADSISRLEDLQAEAQGATAGDLFRYDIKQRITIGKNQSALVPIINAPIDAEKVTLWNSGGGDSKHRALRALWLKNTSDLTLDAGTFNVLDAATFAGEGLVDILKPGERRLVSYAADSAVRVTSDGQSESQPITRVRIARGVMRVTRGERRTTIYKIHNADMEARNVVLEHPLQAGWKLTDEVKPEETSASFYRFRVPVEPDKTTELKLVENHPQETTLSLSALTPDQIQVMFRGRTVPAAIEASLQRIMAKKNEVSGVDQQLRSRQQEMETIGSDQARVRENMKALKGSAEEKALLQRYAQQLNQQEDRLATLRKELADLRSQRDRLGAELDRMVGEVTLDEGM